MRNLYLVALLFFAIFRAAFAQEPSPSAVTFAVTSSEQIVVTGAELDSYNAEDSTAATRLPERILDTDRSVQVVTRQLIEDRNSIDPQEAVQNVSGVQRHGSRTGVGEIFFIRGFQQSGLFKDGFRAGESSGGDVFTFEGATDIATSIASRR